MIGRLAHAAGLRFKAFRGEGGDVYMRKAILGRLALHVFLRGDSDPDCHDHPRGFTTFPLVSYDEEVLDVPTGRLTTQTVRRFCLHRREAGYAHRVLGRSDGTARPIVTLVFWDSPDTVRAWGFHRRDDAGRRCWIPWRRYTEENGRSAMCEDVDGPIAG